MAKSEAKLEYRSDFPDFVFDTFSPSQPVVVINGNVEDQIQVGNKLCYLVDLLVQRAVERKVYDFVILYNAATKDMVFGDEFLRLPKKDLGMKDDFSGLNISLSSDNGAGGDQIAKLLDPNVIKSHSGAEADSAFFTIVKKLSDEFSGKTFLVIVDHGDDIFPDETNTPTGASHATFPSRLTDIVRSLKKGSTDRNVIILNNKGRIASSLTRELPQLCVPHTTESEVRDVLANVIKDPDKLLQATRFAVTLEVGVLMEVVGKAGKDVDVLLAQLIKLRTEKIANMSGGNLEATIGFGKDEVALSPGARVYCDNVARNFFKSPGLVGNGVLLVGPPGTGKSVFPQYIASQIGVPFLRMGSMNTEGLSGRATQKLEQVFAAIEANKPCIVLIDEIDMLIPSGQGAFQSDNDNQFRALFQAKLADDNAMRGVLFFGASNHPENLATPLVRSGRFGDIIAVLPPETVAERIQVFRAVWNQLKNKGDLPKDDAKFGMASDELLTSLLLDLPTHVTGGDFRQMIRDAINNVGKNNSKYNNIWEALFVLKKALMEGKYIKKASDFDDMVAMSLSKQNVDFDDGVDSDEATSFDVDELKALALVRETGRVAGFMVDAGQAQDQLNSRIQALTDERLRISDMLDQGMVALGEKGILLKGQSDDLERRRVEIDASMRQLEQERAEFDAHTAEQKVVFSKIIGNYRADLIDQDRNKFVAVEQEIVRISGYNLTETRSFEDLIRRIDGLITDVAKLKITMFGILIGGDRLDKADSELRSLRMKFAGILRGREDTSASSLSGFQVPRQADGRGHVAQVATPSTTRRSTPPLRTELPGLPNLSPTSRGGFVSNILRTTAGKILVGVLGMSAVAGVYHVATSVSEDVVQNPIIKFASQKEGVDKGYIVIKDGVLFPKEGYEWAYSEDDIAPLVNGDYVPFSVRKIN